MPEATYVAFVPRKKCAELRAILQTESTEPLTWRERRDWFGSEFYFSGPAALARKAQAYVVVWALT